MIHLVIIGMRSNKLIEEVYSSRIKFKYDDNIINVFNYNDEIIGYIKEIYYNNELIIEFDLLEKYHNMGLQTEILREYLRYKYLWEKDIDLIVCYPKLDKTKRVLNKRYFINDNDKYYINKEIYLSHVEKLSLFDENLNLLPYPNLRGEKILSNTYAGIIHVIIKNIKTGRYLTTKRDINKVTSPGLWETTAGGIDYNEKIEDALIREVKEETGLTIIDYKKLDVVKIKDLVYFVYLGFVNQNEEDVKLQANETIDYKWRTKDELIELFNTDLVPVRQKLIINKIVNEI